MIILSRAVSPLPRPYRHVLRMPPPWKAPGHRQRCRVRTEPGNPTNTSKASPTRDHESEYMRIQKYQRRSKQLHKWANGLTSDSYTKDPGPEALTSKPRTSEMITQTQEFNPHLLSVIANSGFFLVFCTMLSIFSTGEFPMTWKCYPLQYTQSRYIPMTIQNLSLLLKFGSKASNIISSAS